MFRPSAIRPLCAFRPAAPVALRHSFARHVSTVRVQPVRFKRRFFTWKRFLAGTIYTGAALTWVHFVLGPTIEIVDEEEEAEGKEEEEEEYDEDEEWEDDTLFIPLGWTKPAPRRFYRGTDPEWQEFKKIASDQKRHERIRLKLISFIRNHFARDPMKRLGNVDVTKGRYWLDIVFPDGPPQEFERAGIEIGDDYIAWTKRPVDQINYWRLQRALWPVAVASGALASSQYLLRVQMQRLQEWIGMSPTPDPRIEVLARHLEALQRAKQAGSGRPLPPPANTSERTVANADPNANPNAAGKTAAVEKHTNLPEFEPVPPQSIALSIFSNKLHRHWKMPRIEAPRGTIIVTGMIEIRGDKASTVVDVSAAYDPLMDKYVITRAGSRLIQDKRQSPKGGR